MAIALESNKTKIARRVIEVMEYFASEDRRATVMDIVRCYGRPQSSTSELMGSMVELGLLYRDPHSRTYAPTPRLAALGAAAQPETIRSGRLFTTMDRLAQTSRCGIGLFGSVGLHAQVFRWSCGADLPNVKLQCGAASMLSSGAAGMMLLASQGLGQASRLLWRLHAEAGRDETFNLNEMKERIARIAATGHALGPTGFEDDTRMVAVMLPEDMAENRLALGAVFRTGARVDPEALAATLQHAVAQLADEQIEVAAVHRPSLIAV